MGIFAGSRPTNLGYSAAKFAPPSWKPNAVSSTIERTDKHYIAPLVYSGISTVAWKKLRAIVAAFKGTKIITEHENYLYAEFSSGMLGFVDDVEFALDQKESLIQVRSASRLGVDDLGANRKRIETIRQRLAST